MSYRKPAAYARKDLLTPGGCNQLRTNARILDQAFRGEHRASTGEHNTPVIARTMGSVQLTGGVYSLTGFDSPTGEDVTLGVGHNPAVGRVHLTLAADRFAANSAPILVQNSATTGASLPCLSYARWESDTEIQVFSTYWNGTLGVAGSGQWEIAAGAGGLDSPFHLGIHGPALGTGAAIDFGPPSLRFEGLRADNASELNQGSADLELALRAYHTAGAHDAPAIAKAWAHVQWTGSHYSILDQACAATFDGAAISSVNATSSGLAEVVFAAPMVNAFYQAFVTVDYPRITGAPSDYFIACVPWARQFDRSLSVYLYKRLLDGGGVEYFERNGAVDFHLWIFDDHGDL